jgi:FkbM family methyltransferase
MKYLIKSIFRKFGIVLNRLSPSTDPGLQLLKGLQKFDIDLVFDIGANTGQFSQSLRSMGYKKGIVSFEPLTDAYTQLTRNAQNDKKWQVHTRGAIGDFNGEISINVAGNSVSSSILPMLDVHISAAGESAYIASEMTPMQKLDSVASKYISKNNNLFVKIDTQGFEWQVLNGGYETIIKSRGLLLELSMLQLYDGQRLWRDIIDRLESEGFTLWAVQNGFTDLHSGRTLQIDAIFFRE